MKKLNTRQIALNGVVAGLYAVQKALEILENGEAFPKAPEDVVKEETKDEGKKKRTAEAYGIVKDPARAYHYASIPVC